MNYDPQLNWCPLIAKVTPAALLTLNERGIGFQLVGRMKRGEREE